MSKSKLGFQMPHKTYDFSEEGMDVEIEDLENFHKFESFFLRLKDKTPFKDDILKLASYYSDNEI